MKNPKKLKAANKVKNDFLLKMLMAYKSEGLPNSIKDPIFNPLILPFIEQVAIMMPDLTDPEDRKSEAYLFAWRLWHCISHINIDDYLTLPSSRETSRIISKTEMALKATKESIELGEEKMFLPISSISQFEKVAHYLGHFDDAKDSLEKALKVLKHFKKAAYSNKRPTERTHGLSLTCGFFEYYLGKEVFEITELTKGYFEKSDNSNKVLYKATPLKLTTNATIAFKSSLREETIRKRLKKSGIFDYKSALIGG